MITKKMLKDYSTMALDQAKKEGATEAEVVIIDGVEELTRFANNMIHQSVSLADTLIHVRFIVGKRIGVARGNRLGPDGIRSVVSMARALATLQREDPHFLSLPTPGSAYPSVENLYDRSKHGGAKYRAAAIATVIGRATRAHLVASGAFSESETITGIANTHGVEAVTKATSASLTAIMSGSGGSGFASESVKGGRDIDAHRVATVALGKATNGKLVDVAPGEYEVILEPSAVSELLDFFAWLGPNARIYHEDVSFYQGNIGKKLFHDSLTIIDDPLQEAGYPIGFDYEGVPKAALTLVKRGVLGAVAYDSYHAGKHGARNTGHALLAPNTWGPMPTHLMIEPGDKTIAHMIRAVKKGLLVTRFWYTRVVHHKQLILTGMTRDGTFLIENGKIVGRVRNLRYTQSIIEALQDIRGIGKGLSLVGSEGSPSLVPAMHLGKFRFTGSAQHR